MSLDPVLRSSGYVSYYPRAASIGDKKGKLSPNPGGPFVFGILRAVIRELALIFARINPEGFVRSGTPLFLEGKRAAVTGGPSEVKDLEALGYRVLEHIPVKQHVR